VTPRSAQELLAEITSQRLLPKHLAFSASSVAAPAGRFRPQAQRIRGSRTEAEAWMPLSFSHRYVEPFCASSSHQPPSLRMLRRVFSAIRILRDIVQESHQRPQTATRPLWLLNAARTNRVCIGLTATPVFDVTSA